MSASAAPGTFTANASETPSSGWIRKDSPFGKPVPAEDARNTVWAEPELVAEVAFDRWTREGRLRAPVYHGLRDDKDPADVVRET